MDAMKFESKVLASLVKKSRSQLDFKGQFHVEHIRNGKVINKIDITNMVTNEGKNAILNIMFHGTTQITTWYLGIIDSDGYSAVAATDTALGINTTNGWNEFTSYSETNRVTWDEGAASSQSITSSTVAEFNIDGTGTGLKGIFVVSSNVKDGTAGTLWSTALFSTPINVAADDVLKITYTLSVTGTG